MGSGEVGSKVNGLKLGDWTTGLRFWVRGGRPEIKGRTLKDWTAGLRFRAWGGRARARKGGKAWCGLQG